MTRVVITGLGAVTPIGQTVDSFWKALTSGVSGAATLTSFDTSGFAVNFGAEVKGFEPGELLPGPQARRLDRFGQFASVTAMQAVADSGLKESDGYQPERVGVIYASGIGGLFTLEEQHTRLLERGPRKMSPFTIPKLMINSGSGQIAIDHGFKGPNFSVVSACASANHAMGMALRLIRCGDADVVVTGGAEAAITPIGLGAFCALRALSRRNDEPERASRPFDKDRDGFVLGEGGATLVFERLEHALAREATIYGEIVGFGQTDDAHHITAPEPEGTGPARAMELALEDAGLQPADVDYINAHGTSTDYNDAMETQAIRRCLGDAAARVAVSSTKSMTGHLLGGAAAIEAVASILALKHGVLPPTINLDEPAPECDLDYVPNEARQQTVEVALSNSFGFGGHNTTVAFRRWNGNS